MVTHNLEVGADDIVNVMFVSDTFVAAGQYAVTDVGNRLMLDELSAENAAQASRIAELEAALKGAREYAPVKIAIESEIGIEIFQKMLDNQKNKPRNA